MVFPYSFENSYDFTTKIYPQTIPNSEDLERNTAMSAHYQQYESGGGRKYLMMRRGDR